MHRHPAGKRGVTPGHPRPCVSTICRTKLRDIHALAALLRFWVVNACLPRDNACLCTLHRVRLAWEVCLQKFKLSLSVVVQFGSHKRPQQGRGELKNRLKMVGYDRDCTSTCPKKIFVVLIPIQGLVRVGRLVIWRRLPKWSVNWSSCRRRDWRWYRKRSMMAEGLLCLEKSGHHVCERISCLLVRIALGRGTDHTGWKRRRWTVDLMNGAYKCVIIIIT